LLAWMAVPIGATYLISLHRPVYVDRYLSVALPPFILWTALGITSLPRHWRPIAAGLLLSASALATVGTLSGARFRKEDWRCAVSHVAEASRPGDQLFVINPEDVPVVRYYLGGDVPLTVGLPNPPPEGGSWFLYRIPAESNHELGEPKGASFQRDADPEVLRWLAAHDQQIVEHSSFAGLELFLIDGCVEL